MSAGTLARFYKSKRWEACRRVVMERAHWLCERCGAPAVVAHHRVYLTEENVTDPRISLNPDLIEALCYDCHNKEHFKPSTTPRGLAFDRDGNLVPISPRDTAQPQATAEGAAPKREREVACRSRHATDPTSCSLDLARPGAQWRSLRPGEVMPPASLSLVARSWRNGPSRGGAHVLSGKQADRRVASGGDAEDGQPTASL